MGTATSNLAPNSRFSWNASATFTRRYSSYSVILDLLFGFITGVILSIVAVSFILKKLKRFLRFNPSAPKSLLTNLFTQKTPSQQFSHEHSSRTWMYELCNEDFNSNIFSLSMTRLCLIEIRNSILFVFEPSNEPDRKLTDDELYSNVDFNQVQIYNLNKSIVGLLPNNMTRSKYWSKKCPIVLRHVLYLGNETIVDSILANNFRKNSMKINEVDMRKGEEKTILLFTRTRRSKEDWFYRFVNASQLATWREEIRHQLLLDNGTQVLSMENTTGRTDTSTENDKEQQRRMLNFLERSDRFSAPDQLPDLKPVDVLQRFLPGFQTKIRKTKKNHQSLLDQSNNGGKTVNSILERHVDIHHSNKEMSDYKRHYCEQWLREHSLSEKPKPKEESKYDRERYFKNSYSHRDVNKNRKGVSTVNSQISTQILGASPFQHPLVFFTLRCLQTMSHTHVENDIHSPVSLINIFAARFCLDFFDNGQYLERFLTMIQKHLAKLSIPFVEHVTITRLSLGDRLPEIKDIFKPWSDEHGLWCHVKIAFDGRFQLSLAAKLKWIRKHRAINKRPSSYQHSSSKIDHAQQSIAQNHLTPQSTKLSWRKRLWSPIRWLSQKRRSRHKSRLSLTVNHAEANMSHLNNENDVSSQNDYKHTSPYPRRVLPKVSKTTIVIKMEMNHLNGILVINIPPIPSDRIWIGFLDMPEMAFSATPHLGEFRVPFYRIRDKLEKKLRQLFRRYLVIPNMKDFIIPTVNDHLCEVGIVKAAVASKDQQEVQRSTDANRTEIDEDDLDEP